MDQGRSPLWAGVGRGLSEKIKKSMTINLFCDILNNFAMSLVFSRFKFLLIGLVAHLEN